MLMSESGSPLGRPKVRTKLLATHHSLSRILDSQDVLSGDSLLAGQPLPNRPLSDSDPAGEFGLGELLFPQIGFEVHAPILGDLVPKVNSYLVADRCHRNHVAGMGNVMREESDDSVPLETKQREGQALAALWKSRRKRSQAAFASEHGFTQGNFSHYIGGRQPIPLHIGIAIAEELGITLADFSPRLAAEMEAERAREARIWPFKSLRPENFRGLTRGQLMAVESAMLRTLEEFSPPERSVKP
jgi:hypothetical protein